MKDIILNKDRYQPLMDQPYTITCPLCGTKSGITAVSVPLYEQVRRFDLKSIGVVFKCDACNDPIFVKYKVFGEFGSERYTLLEPFEEIERAREPYEYKYLPESVAGNFKEALACYSNATYNAFAAMSRRTVQAIAINLGRGGSDRVLNQLKELKELAQIDDETFDILRQIIIDGHDGAHPHLPDVDADRAEVLLVLMKDVLTQVYVRKAKLKEAADLRSKAIASRNSS